MANKMNPEETEVFWNNVALIEGFVNQLLEQRVIPGTPCEQAIAFMGLGARMSRYMGNIDKKDYMAQCEMIYETLEKDDLMDQEAQGNG